MVNSKEKVKKNDNEKLIDLSRSGLNISLSHDYKIVDLNKMKSLVKIIKVQS